MLVMAGKPVDATIDSLLQFLEPGDCIIDGGNEWCDLCGAWKERFHILSGGKDCADSHWQAHPAVTCVSADASCGCKACTWQFQHRCVHDVLATAQV